MDIKIYADIFRKRGKKLVSVDYLEIKSTVAFLIKYCKVFNNQTENRRLVLFILCYDMGITDYFNLKDMFEYISQSNYDKASDEIIKLFINDKLYLANMMKKG